MALTNLTIKVDSDVVKTEGANRYSRDEDTIASGSGVLQCGAVLGKVTSTGKLKPLAPGASDGTQTAVKVLLESVDATSADVRAVTLARHAEVVLQTLVFAGGVTAPQQAAARAALETQGIIARMGV
jgi:hypothetical protein